KGQAEGTWSGTLSMTSTSTSHTGKNQKQINIILTNNKGTGTVAETQELILDGKLYCMGICKGTGPSELLSLIINYTESIYSWEVGVPTYTCTNSGIACDLQTAEMGPSGFSAFDKPLGNTPNYLSGSETKTEGIPGMGSETTTTTWHLVRASNHDLIVTPQNYDSWLPVAGRDELTKGSVMNISLKVQGKNGQKATIKTKSFELTLSNTSKEPGITLNAPLVPSVDQLPDLRFLQHPTAESKDEDQSITIDCLDGFTGKVNIGSYDGGGWTTLTATAILEDNSRIKGCLLIPGGETDILIPKRDPGSKIATAWLKANGNPGELDDKEYSTGNSNDGDGLTAYEEYRGFISEGKFLRLDPNKKELGVRLKKAELPLFMEGLKWFENASFIKVVRFIETEIGLDRRLNKNFKSAHNYDQYALILEKGGLPTGVGGQAFNYGGPKTTTLILIDVDQIDLFYNIFTVQARPARLLYTKAELLANTVAHELSHGVDVKHHGRDPNEPDPQVAETTSVPPYRIFKHDGSQVTIRPYAISAIGTEGSQQSGDLSCIIAYNPYHKWAFTIGADGANIFNEVPQLPMGRRMCASKKGTGINATVVYFGNARAGNCLSQINLKL
ncbi:MAG: hypothetical protein ACRDEB_06480, partial [Chitinophagaceae bacterium]